MLLTSHLEQVREGGSEDALRAIRKQVRRNRNKFEVEDHELPVVATIAKILRPYTTF